MSKTLIFSCFSILLSAILIPLAYGQASEITSQTISEPVGIATMGKDLTISEHRYRNTNQITGTINNNSTEEISDILVYAAVFDENNRFTDIYSAAPLVSTLPAGDNSPFSINIYSFSPHDEIVGSYILFVKGSSPTA